MRGTRRVLLEVAGWTLVIVGIAAMVLPGPGLLMLFGGIYILSNQYAWAQRWLAPVKFHALTGAAESVQTWPRILVSAAGVVGLLLCGALWIWSPPAPEWWSLDETWWLPGGLAVAVTQIGSALIAVALLVYSYRRFRGQPEKITALREEYQLARSAQEQEAAH